MINKYTKKPVTVNAVQYLGTNMNEISKFIKEHDFFVDNDGNLIIKTLEGNMCASEGDYIIQGVKGEYYPCKPDIFNETYERNDDFIIRLKSELKEVNEFTEKLDKRLSNLEKFLLIDDSSYLSDDAKEDLNNQRLKMVELYFNLKSYISILNSRYKKLS